MTDVIEEFATLVRQHDVSFEYSDDHSAWTRGHNQRAAIMALFSAQSEETKATMRDTWDAVKRARFTPYYVHEYLWRGH